MDETDWGAIGDRSMKARFAKWLKVLMVMPLMGAFAFEGCTADTLRLVAETLDDRADEIDGEDEDFGDWLADEIRDW
jgi:hypothetical protein